MRQTALSAQHYAIKEKNFAQPDPLQTAFAACVLRAHLEFYMLPVLHAQRARISIHLDLQVASHALKAKLL